MSTKQILGTAGGAVAGFFMSGGNPLGAVYGGAMGYAAASALDQPKIPDMQIGRLSDLTVQSSTYGAFIPRIYGTVAITGNVFWLENNALLEHSTTSGGGGGKGGGDAPSTTSYTYSATFAVGLCEGEIGGILRMWIGPKLVYDVSPTASAETLAASQHLLGWDETVTDTIYDNNDNPVTTTRTVTHPAQVTFYNGSDTQLPDARMQATLGVANTPAYRGLAYIVFNDLDLSPYGNTLMGATVKVEAAQSVTYKTPNVITATVAVGSHPYGICFDSTTNSVWATNYSNNTVSKINVSTNTVTATVGANIGPYVMCFDSATNSVWVTGYSGLSKINVLTNVVTGVGVEPGGHYGICFDPVTNSVWISNSNSNTVSKINVLTAVTDIIYVGSGPYGMCFDSTTNSVWVVSYSGSVINKINVSTNTVTATVGVGPGPYGSPFCICFDSTTNSVWVSDYNIAFVSKINVLTNSVIDTLTVPISSYTYCMCFDSATDSVWICSNSGNVINKINVSTNTITTTITSSNSPSGICFDPTTNSVWVTNAYGNNVSKIYTGGNIQPDSITVPKLSSIVSTESLKSNLITGSDLDTSLLTSDVNGYRVAALSSVRAAIDPLASAYPFDVIQHGYKLKFIPRGGSSIATIHWQMLDARGMGQSEGVQITVDREMDSSMPSKVIISYLDAGREYDAGEQYCERLNTDAVNTRTIQLPLVLSATQASGKAESLLYMYWMERYDVAFNLPATYNHLEPSDIVTVSNYAGNTYELRLTSVNYTSDGRVECIAKVNKSSIYTPVAVGSEGLTTGKTITTAAQSTGIYIDAATMTDAGNTSAFLFGAFGSTTGTTLVVTDDDGQNWGNTVSIATATTIGTVSGVATPYSISECALIDKRSILTVTMKTGTLASTTELAMLNGANYFAYGAEGRWEVIAAQNCTLQSAGVYVLTDFLRGRYGTEYNTGNHISGDYLVALSTTNPSLASVPTSKINQVRTYRAVSNGRLISTAGDREYKYTGNNLKPLSPVYPLVTPDLLSGDWAISWKRRSRGSAELMDYVDAPLNESVESYEIEIYSDANYTAVVRTLSASTNSAIYSGVMQVADFGAHQSSVYAKVYQLSATIGRGYPLQTVLATNASGTVITITNITVAGVVNYLASSGSSWWGTDGVGALVLYDITDLNDPVKQTISSVTIPTKYRTPNVYIVGNYMYLLGVNTSTYYTSLTVVNLTIPSVPVISSNSFTVESISTIYTNDSGYTVEITPKMIVNSSGNYAYIQTFGKIITVNTTTKTSLSVASTLSYMTTISPNGNNWGNTGMWLSGNGYIYARYTEYVGTAGSYNVQKFAVVNISTPSTPTLTGSAIFPSLGDYLAVVEFDPVNSYAYGVVNNTMKITLLSTPTTESISATLANVPYCLGGAIDIFGDMLYLNGDYYSTIDPTVFYLHIYDIVNKTAPYLVRSLVPNDYLDSKSYRRVHLVKSGTKVLLPTNIYQIVETM